MRIWDLKSLTNAATFEGGSAQGGDGGGGVRALAFSENGYHLASAAEDGLVKVRPTRRAPAPRADALAPRRALTRLPPLLRPAMPFLRFV